jgi:hypothetical protein
MRWLLIVSTMVLTACQSWHEPSETSPYYAVPVGSRLILNQPITIPADKASIYIQRGQAVSYSGRDFYYANCQFEVNTVKSVAQTIEPDEFIVNRVSQRIEVNRLFVPGTMIAGMGIHKSDVTDKFYGRVLYLRSSKQPDVFRISCGRWDDRPLSNHLTIQEIRGALGDLFTLRLPAQG